MMGKASGMHISPYTEFVVKLVALLFVFSSVATCSVFPYFPIPTGVRLKIATSISLVLVLATCGVTLESWPVHSFPKPFFFQGHYVAFQS